MDGPSLRVAGPGDQGRLLEHLNVLGHRLFRDVERRGQLVNRGRSAGQPRHDRTPNRVGQREESAVQPGVCTSITPQLSTLRLINYLIDYKGRRTCGRCQGVISALLADDGAQLVESGDDLTLRAVVGRLVIVDTDEFVGRILLRHNTIRVVVAVFVADGIAHVGRTGGR